MRICLKVRERGIYMNKGKKNKSLSMCIKLMGIIIKEAPLKMILYSINTIILGIVLSFNIVALDGFFSAINLYCNGKGNLMVVIFEIIKVFLLIVANPIVNSFGTVLSRDSQNKVVGILNGILNKRCGRLSVLEYEKNSVLDKINKAIEGTKHCFNFVESIIYILFIYFVYFLVVGSYLYKQEPILIICVGIVFIPIIISQIYKGKMYEKLENCVAPIRRKYDYYENCMINREYFKETRILGVFSKFKRLFGMTTNEYNKEVLDVCKKSNKIEALFKIITLSGYISIFLLLVFLVIKGKISIATFGTIVASVDMMFTMSKELVVYIIGDMLKNFGKVKNYMMFIDEELEEKENVCINCAPSILFENVSFGYINEENDEVRNVIENISIKIHEGETVAIVGENGAGKSTFSRLAMGMYQPCSGRVLINGYDTNVASYESLMKNTSSVFQKYQRYKLNLEDNIQFCGTTYNEKKIPNSYSEDRLIQVIEESGLEVTERSFPKGCKTLLAKEFGGVDVSGGQWQRIAIARGLYKSHNFIILDEPTSAIDPIEETRLLNKFYDICRNKTAIIITHRLASAKIADRIIVMDKGKIIQEGKHDDLIKVEGKYREMFMAQAKYY